MKKQIHAWFYTLHTHSRTVVVWCRDTDVMLMLIAHSATINKDIYMKVGTSNKPKFIQINDIITGWNFNHETVLSLLPFHAITGSDTTSYLVGHSKRT